MIAASLRKKKITEGDKCPSCPFFCNRGEGVCANYVCLIRFYLQKFAIGLVGSNSEDICWKLLLRCLSQIPLHSL